MMQYNRDITATVYVLYKDRVLLHIHKKYNLWFPPGGHVEPDEFPHNTAVREVFEETGLRVKLASTESAPYIALGSVERIPAPFCTMREGIGSDREFYDFIFVAFADTDKVSPPENESKVFRWFSKDDLQDNTVIPHIRNTALAILDNYT